MIILIIHNTLAQDETNYYSEIVKPVWIKLPSTSNKINIQDIYEKNDIIKSKYVMNSSTSNSYECLDFDNIFNYDPLVIKPHWTNVFSSPEPSPSIVYVSNLEL